MKKILIVLISVFIVFFSSCETELPIPISGTYILESNTSATYWDAMFYFGSDGTFRYMEVVGNEKVVYLKGSYSHNLSFYDFENANGSIVINVVYPEDVRNLGISNLLINDGVTNFSYDWKADRETGPLGMTLARGNGELQSDNYELKQESFKMDLFDAQLDRIAEMENNEELVLCGDY